MKHNTTSIFLLLFILSPTSFSSCADTSEKKETKIPPSPMMAYLPSSEDSNLETCVLWRLSHPISITKNKEAYPPYYPSISPRALSLINLCIIKGTASIINGIVEAAQDHPSDSLDTIKESWGRKYIQQMPMGKEYCERLDIIESFNPEDNLYRLSEPNDEDTKISAEITLSQMTLSVEADDDKMALLVPPAYQPTYQSLLKFPPVNFDQSNPDDHIRHLATLVGLKNVGHRVICLFNPSIDLCKYFSDKEPITVTEYPISELRNVNGTYCNKNSTAKVTTKCSNWHVANTHNPL